MRIVDLSAKAAGADPVAVLIAWIEEESSIPFDTYRVPPVRAMLARLGKNDHALLILMHHVSAPSPALRPYVAVLSAEAGLYVPQMSVY